MFSAAAVRRMLVPLKLALSKRTIFVSGVISLFSPPMTPARPTGLCSSQMQSMLGVTLRSLPSSVRQVSPSRAVRTMMCPPSTQEKSKACIGWPYSIIT